MNVRLKFENGKYFITSRYVSKVDSAISVVSNILNFQRRKFQVNYYENTEKNSHNTYRYTGCTGNELN